MRLVRRKGTPYLPDSTLRAVPEVDMDAETTPDERRQVAFSEPETTKASELAPEDEAIPPLPRSPGEIRRLNLMLNVRTEWPRPSTSPAGVELPPLPSKPNPSRKIHKPPDQPDIPEFLTHTYVGFCRKCELLRRRSVGESRPVDSPDHAMRLVRGPFDTCILLPRYAPLPRSSSVPALQDRDGAWECWRRRQKAAEEEAEKLEGAIARRREEDEEDRREKRRIFDAKATAFGYAPRRDLTPEEHAEKLRMINEAKEKRKKAKAEAKERAAKKAAEAEAKAIKEEELRVKEVEWGTEADWDLFSLKLPCGKDKTAKRRREVCTRRTHARHAPARTPHARTHACHSHARTQPRTVTRTHHARAHA